MISESSSAALLALYSDDPELMVWWGTEIEIVSALSRLERRGELSIDGMDEALRRWQAVLEARSEILPTERVRQVARRLLRVHDLRAADALQLAAAHVGAEETPPSLHLVTLDARLAAAARREGFSVIGADVT